MKIYLAGSVPKGNEEAKSFIDWRKEWFDKIQKFLPEAELSDPSVALQFEGDSLAVTGADCWLIQQCDLVLVNAQSKLGAGTSMEYLIAKYFKKPIITILPKDTHHRRSNVVFGENNLEDWIHPFIDTFSDTVIQNVNELQKAWEEVKSREIKDIKTIDRAISYFRSK